MSPFGWYWRAWVVVAPPWGQFLVSFILPYGFLCVFRLTLAGVFWVVGGAIWIAGLALAQAWVKGETLLVQHQRAQDKQEHPLLCSGRSGQRKEAARRSVAWLLKI
jgi:hypothetical protein